MGRLEHAAILGTSLVDPHIGWGRGILAICSQREPNAEFIEKCLEDFTPKTCLAGGLTKLHPKHRMHDAKLEKKRNVGKRRTLVAEDK